MNITGQLMTQSQQGTTKDGRILVAVFGVIAVPEGSELDITHRQFIVEGESDWSELHTNMKIHHMGTQDHPDCRGMGMAGIMTSPIWRV